MVYFYYVQVIFINFCNLVTIYSYNREKRTKMEKIPDIVLHRLSREEIRSLQIEIGKLQSEKQELADALVEKDKDIRRYINDAKLTKREALYAQLQNEHQKVCLRVHELRQRNDRLIEENIQLKIKLNS